MFIREKILAEASPTDRVWGIGLSLTDGRSRKVSEWRGKNILGFTLMKVRDSFLSKSVDCKLAVLPVHNMLCSY